jgi:hypothetical protein
MKYPSRYKLSDPAVIAANRRGKMLSTQRPWLGQNLYPSQVIILVPFLIGLLTSCVLGLLFLTLPSLFANISVFVLFSYIVIIFFGAAGILGSLYLLFHVITWKRLSIEPIEQAEGKITWNGQSYVAKIHERRLKPCGRMNLLPGTYRFFYLPHTGWLLSAEKLTSEKQQAMLDLHNALIQANHFSLETVTANREGQLSDDQILQLEHLRSRYFVEGLLLLVSVQDIVDSFISKMVQDIVNTF